MIFKKIKYHFNELRLKSFDIGYSVEVKDCWLLPDYKDFRRAFPYLKKDIGEWLFENIKGGYFYRSKNSDCIFTFAQKSDAALFKLIWS